MHSLSYRALPLLLSFALLALMGVLRPDEVRPTPPATGGGAPTWEEGDHQAYSTDTLTQDRSDETDDYEADSALTYTLEEQLMRGDGSLSEELDLGDISVQVYSNVDPGESASNPRNTLLWTGGEVLELDQSILDGVIYGITVCDLDSDGHKELALYSKGGGSRAPMDFLLLEWADGQWTSHKLCPLPEDTPELPEGSYLARGEYPTIWDDSVDVLRPIFKRGDAMCCPSGGWHRVRYTFTEDTFHVLGVSTGPSSESWDNAYQGLCRNCSGHKGW